MGISIVIIDDHPVITHGLKAILGKHHNYDVVGEADDANKGMEVIEKTQPDIVILDISMKSIDGISLIAKIKEVSNQSKIIMYTMHDSKDYIGRSIRAGALAYVLKSDSPDQLIAAITSSMKSSIYLSPNIPPSLLGELISNPQPSQSSTESLTPREFEIASLIAKGHTVDEIGDLLFISPKTVRVHRTNIMHKFSCNHIHDLLLQLRQHFPQ